MVCADYLRCSTTCSTSLLRPSSTDSTISHDPDDPNEVVEHDNSECSVVAHRDEGEGQESEVELNMIEISDGEEIVDKLIEVDSRDRVACQIAVVPNREGGLRDGHKLAVVCTSSCLIEGLPSH